MIIINGVIQDELENRERELEIKLESIRHQLGLLGSIKVFSENNSGLYENYKKYCKLKAIAEQIESELCMIKEEKNVSGHAKINH